MTFEKLQSDFIRAIECPEISLSGLSSRDAKRFSIYRNNVIYALSAALADAYPAVVRIVGDEFFAVLARAFIHTETTRKESLALYGEGFAEFVRRFEPAAAVAYLSDVASLERAWLESLHSAEATPVLASQINADKDLTQLRFRAHPALRIVQSTHPIVSLWRANTEPVTAKTIEILNQAEIALVTRPGLTPQVDMLDVPSAIFASALAAGLPVAYAFESAREVEPGFDVRTTFAHLLNAGGFDRVLYVEDQANERA